MTAPTLDDALADTAPDRALLISVDFRIDPTWTPEQLACHLMTTAALAYRRLLPELQP